VPFFARFLYPEDCVQYGSIVARRASAQRLRFGKQMFDALPFGIGKKKIAHLSLRPLRSDMRHHAVIRL
jgi:hypothetical protein